MLTPGLVVRLQVVHIKTIPGYMYLDNTLGSKLPLHFNEAACLINKISVTIIINIIIL